MDHAYGKRVGLISLQSVRQRRAYDAALRYVQTRGYDGDELPTGDPCLPDKCPVARALADATGGHVLVSCNRAWFFSSASTNFVQGHSEPLPQRVMQFIQFFDEGRFPHLST